MAIEIRNREDGSRYVLAYNYDEVTGEYIGFEQADESPLEPGVFMLPAFSTAIEPPAFLEGYYRKWNGTEWIQEALPEPLPPSPEPPITEEQARAERNNKLLESDWAMLTDVPISNRSEWVTYRQSLRDVPQQAGFPTDIDWPAKPEYIKS